MDGSLRDWTGHPFLEQVVRRYNSSNKDRWELIGRNEKKNWPGNVLAEKKSS